MNVPSSILRESFLDRRYLALNVLAKERSTVWEHIVEMSAGMRKTNHIVISPSEVVFRSKRRLSHLKDREIVKDSAPTLATHTISGPLFFQDARNAKDEE